jgi:hypothetical protein
VKILPLLTPLLFALSLTGAVQAEVDVAVPAPVAPATIEVAKCAPHAAVQCLISGDTVVEDDDSVDLAALPKSNPNQQALVDAAMPVPEPKTFGMMAIGLALLGFASRRRQPSDKFGD